MLEIYIHISVVGFVPKNNKCVEC